MKHPSGRELAAASQGRAVLFVYGPLEIRGMPLKAAEVLHRLFRQSVWLTSRFPKVRFPCEGVWYEVGVGITASATITGAKILSRERLAQLLPDSNIGLKIEL